MRIGEVAAKAGVSVRALRYYEEQDLLHSTRNRGGQRQYTADAVERVGLIRRLYSAGLPSRIVREVLSFADAGGASPELVGLLTAERDRLDRQMTDLREARDRLHACITEAHAMAGRNAPPATAAPATGGPEEPPPARGGGTRSGSTEEGARSATRGPGPFSSQPYGTGASTPASRARSG
ncbi:MerR family transcriptional regulator [Streptomyces sp. st140]|uniref:MerR family transcriptional regulator n=1 Tax=Streptomyces sp. st140 TaxID=1828052 RepID=UPI000BF03939|nr:MerR family transcriptional regulator [Streptomyces sp. st140]